MKISSIKNLMSSVYESQDALLIQGVHGIGKSKIIEQFAKENNFHIETLFLSHQDIGDILGIPHTVVKENETITTWAKPVWLQRMEQASFPKNTKIEDLEFTDSKFKQFCIDSLPNEINSEIITNSYNLFYGTNLSINEFLATNSGVSNTKGKPCILFLDELNRAQKEQRDLGLQLVLSREIHQHKLPKFKGIHTGMVAAINPSDKYQVSELDPALLDRFLFVEGEVDVDSWVEWAKSKKINRIIIDFILQNPSKLHFIPAEGSIDEISATPRSWEMLSNYIDKIDSIPEELHFQIIKGKVGSAIGSEFLIFFKEYSKIITVDDIEKVFNSIYKKSGFQLAVNAVKELTQDMEPVMKNDMAKTLQEKYLVHNTREEILPYLAFLYSLELEILGGYLKGMKTDKNQKNEYSKLANLDFDKKLFLKFVNAQVD